MTRHVLTAPAEHELEVRHSRFRARAVPLAAGDDPMARLADLSDPAATHNCWAWRIDDAYRSSDDGEPAGTAGRAILAAIDGQGFDRVLVVVTRWYGGIKLGAGGLVRAYGGAAAECLRTAPRTPIVPMATLSLACPFDALGAVHQALAAFDADKLEESFDTRGARITLRLPVDHVDAFRDQVRNATRDQATWPEIP
ncbi:IMPACT family protein [Luteimonas pelagia]